MISGPRPATRESQNHGSRDTDHGSRKMAYAQLDSPLPNLTMTFHPGAHALLRGCPPCGMGSEVPPIDPGVFDNLPLTVPTYPPVFLDPSSGLMPIDTMSLWLGDSPWIGDVFQNVGPDEYLNIQTGQVVPGSVATEIAAATRIPSGVLQTAGTESGVTLIDPTTGVNYTGILTQAAQALKATGQLVDAAGKLTSQGRSLAASGQLVSAPVSPVGANISSAISSLTSWFNEKTLFSAFPNYAVVGGGLLGLMVAPSLFSKSKRRRR